MMHSSSLIRCAVLLVAGLCAQTTTAQTLRRDYAFGGSGQETNVGVLPTANGGLLFGGSTFSAVSGEVTQPSPAPVNSGDFWLVQTDAQGTKLWDKRYGGTEDDRLVKLLPTTDGGYLLCGWTNSPAGYDLTEPPRGSNGYGATDYWVVKIDAQGRKQWDKRFGSSGSDMLTTAVAAPDGSFLLVGTTTPDTQGNAAPTGDRTQPVQGQYDVWLVKIDAAGSKQWDKCLGSPATDYAHGAINTPGGFLIGALAGLGSSNSAPGGDVTGSSHGGNDFWLVKVSDQGAKVWDRLYGGTSNDVLSTMLATPDGGALIGSRSFSPIGGDKSVAVSGKNIWLLKLDAQGTKQWDNVYGFSGNWPDDDGIGKLIINPLGGYFIGGSTTPTSSLYLADFNLGIISVDATGTEQWQRVYGGTDQDYLTDIVPRTDHTLLVSQSSSDVGRDKTVNGRGQYDVWALEISNTVLAAQPARPQSAAAMLYPNPVADGYVTLQVADDFGQQPRRATIYNSQGQRIQTLNLTGKSSQQIDVSAWPAGLYTVVLQTREGTVTRSLIKR